MSTPSRATHTSCRLSVWLALGLGLLTGACLMLPPAAGGSATAAPKVWKPLRPSAATACATQGLAARGWVKAGSTAGALVWVNGGRADRLRAKELVREIRSKIWPVYRRLFGTHPPSDAGQRCFHGVDGRLDIWISRSLPQSIRERLKAPVAAAVFSYGRSPCSGPAYVAINPAVKLDRFVAAHELFHAFQRSFATAVDCTEYHPWNEGLATWAAQSVYPRDNNEHSYRNVVEAPEYPMIASPYGTWSFFYYLTKTQPGGRALIRGILDAFGRAPPEPAIDRAIPGGFRKRIPEFALYAWNQEPVTKTRLRRSFREWDNFAPVPLASLVPRRALPVRPVNLGGESVRVVPFEVGLAWLSRRYFHFRVLDERVRLVEFENGLFRRRHSSVQAFVRLAGGRWNILDWTNRDKIRFCREKPKEDVEELIIIFSNTGTAPSHRITPRRAAIRAEDTCKLSTISGTFSGSGDGTTRTYGNTVTWSGSATFAPTKAYTAGDGRRWQEYTLVSGSVTVHSSGGSRCQFLAGPKTITFPRGAGMMRVQLDPKPGQRPLYDGGIASGASQWNYIPARLVCPNAPPGEFPWYHAGAYISIPPDLHRVGAGGTMSGQFTDAIDNEQTFRWSLRLT